MVKKVIDILPPQAKSVLQEEEKKPLLIEEKVKLAEPVEKKSKRGLFWLFIPLILIFLVAFYFRISKVEIKIWPKTDTITLKTKLAVAKGIESLDFENKVIPGEIFEVEKTFSEEFSSSGKVLKKAEGIIRVYNAYDTKPELWQAGTRFVSADGKLFKSKDKISVPGAEIKNGKISPTFVDVPVIASEGGVDYNIGPSHFSIIAFRGTPRYTKFYGESFESMTGGGEVAQVTKEDIKIAQDALAEKAKTAAQEFVKTKIPAEFVVLEEATETKILEKFSLAQAEAEMEKFTFQVKTKSTILSFKKEDINNFGEEFVLSQIENGKSVLKKNLTLDYFGEDVNFESGRLLLALNISAKVYPEIDLQSLKKSLIGKSADEAKFFLENYPQVSQVDISFRPFFIKIIPQDIGKIEIEYPSVD